MKKEQILVTGRDDRFKVSASDTTTELFRDMMVYLTSRKETIRDQLTGVMSEDKTQTLRGNYAELMKLEKNINPKVLPTSQEQKKKLWPNS